MFAMFQGQILPNAVQCRGIVDPDQGPGPKRNKTIINEEKFIKLYESIQLLDLGVLYNTYTRTLFN